MARKLIIVADPGIDGAFAVALALHDPELDLLGLAATSGNVNAEQATRNVHILIEQLDPPRWPRLGAALPINYDVNAVKLHGNGGLGGVDFPCAQLHHPHPSDKLISDLIHLHPKELAVVLMGPASTFARALDRDAEIGKLIDRLIVVGGSWHEPGDAGAVSEFHFFCDPPAARQVLRCGAPITLLPLDVTRKLLFAPTELLSLPASESRTTRFLRHIVPQGIAGAASMYGVEGFYLQDVLGLIPLVLPQALTTRSVAVDVELSGELTRGMSVFDLRWGVTAKHNVELVTAVDVPAVRQYIQRILSAE
jgi:inosine-uridine nucleoside N-ribohydrolase